MKLLRKLSRVYHTLKYLKFTQVFFQVWYRVKAPFISHLSYDKYLGKATHPLPFRFPALIPHKNKANAENQFCFLNLSKDFGPSIDWNFSGHGKLWSYNLQYFDYLHDDEIPHSKKQEWLDDFSDQLLNRKIKPEPYPVSLRVINWILYASATGYNQDNFIKALQYQVRYLECNLEYHILANHYLENLVTLCIAAAWLRNEKLAKFAFAKLERQLDEQTLNDGAHYECSPMYHCIILSRLLLMLDVLGPSPKQINHKSTLQNAASNMLGWLQAFSFENGSYALVNDATNNIAPTKETLDAVARELGLEPAKVRLGECGYRKFSNDQVELIVDAGKIMPTYQPGHAHSDMLSFCLQHKGKALLVDTGISTYNNCATRSRERSTAAHNTVTVSGKNQSDAWSAFRVGKRASVSILEEEANRLKALCKFSNGNNISHFRTFTIDRNLFLIEDEMKGDRLENVEARFHFDHSVQDVRLSENYVSISGDDVIIEFNNFAEIVIGEYQQAIEFNHYRKAKTVSVKFNSQLQTKFIFN